MGTRRSGVFAKGSVEQYRFFRNKYWGGDVLSIYSFGDPAHVLQCILEGFVPREQGRDQQSSRGLIAARHRANVDSIGRGNSARLGPCSSSSLCLGLHDGDIINIIIVLIIIVVLLSSITNSDSSVRVVIETIIPVLSRQGCLK